MYVQEKCDWVRREKIKIKDLYQEKFQVAICYFILRYFNGFGMLVVCGYRSIQYNKYSVKNTLCDPTRIRVTKENRNSIGV